MHFSVAYINHGNVCVDQHPNNNLTYHDTHELKQKSTAFWWLHGLQCTDMCQVLGHTSLGSSLQLSHPHCPIHTCDQMNALTQCSIGGLQHLHDSSTQGLGFHGGWKSCLQGLGFNRNTHHGVHPLLDWYNVCMFKQGNVGASIAYQEQGRCALVVYIHTYILSQYTSNSKAESSL